ncbi:peptide deformylase [uncultured Tateyamaria sp.]|uniref:peptide deformylase n=1 Tax=uncultured Tateyamaria sp. TaxID=455651 RepID=UPI002634E087|nr:peptide deformylase [uncultured Tateyamaria sp.]
MSLREILTWPHPLLQAVCPPVEAVTPEVLALAEDMLDTMYAAPGRGLAARQIGELARLFVMDVTWKDGERSPVVCINPDILERGEELASMGEGCLSIPGVTAQVERPTSVRMVWTDLDGVVQEQWLTGFAALCAQHELDHLDGIVTLDRVDDAQRSTILDAYEAQV